VHRKLPYLFTFNTIEDYIMSQKSTKSRRAESVLTELQVGAADTLSAVDVEAIVLGSTFSRGRRRFCLSVWM